MRVFDVLYWERKQMLDSPLYERRKITEKISEKRIKPSKQRKIKTYKTLGKWFNKLVNSNYEGLVCKNPDSLYLPGKRTTDWIKLKRSETMDLAVLGVYMEDSQISQLLCGSYNSKTKKFETLTKVNAKREGMNKEIYPLLKDYFRSSPKQIEIKPELNKPDYFINPLDSIVVEVAAMNVNRTKNIYSCGLENGKSYSLRIAWLKQVRDDKKPLQATTTDQIAMLYQKEKSD
jgi:DNA ligase-1